MRCAFGNCGREHDLWVKIYPGSEVVPICRGCAETESEKYHISFKHGRDPEEVGNYILAYDPDEAFAEQLIEATDLLEQAISQYEGSSRVEVEVVTDATDEIEKVIGNL